MVYSYIKEMIRGLLSLSPKAETEFKKKKLHQKFLDQSDANTPLKLNQTRPHGKTVFNFYLTFIYPTENTNLFFKMEN